LKSISLLDPYHRDGNCSTRQTIEYEVYVRLIVVALPSPRGSQFRFIIVHRHTKPLVAHLVAAARPCTASAAARRGGSSPQHLVAVAHSNGALAARVGEWLAKRET